MTNSNAVTNTSTLKDNLAIDSRVNSDNIVISVNELNKIKNFRQLSPLLASAGMPKTTDLVQLKEHGYQHIINLIPGEFDAEQEQVNSLAMSFDQIPVDWHSPTLADFEKFVQLMNNHQHEKVLVHCQLNYRASAFAYLYQTTQLGISETDAKRQLHAIWQPKGTWRDFISQVHQHYKK